MPVRQGLASMQRVVVDGAAKEPRMSDIRATTGVHRVRCVQPFNIFSA